MRDEYYKVLSGCDGVFCGCVLHRRDRRMPDPGGGMMQVAITNNSMASTMLAEGMAIQRHLTDGEIKQAGERLETVSRMDRVARDLKANIKQLNTVIEYQFWIMRDMGLYLEEHAPHGGQRPSKCTVGELGISKRLAERCRLYATIHTEDARTYFEAWDETKGELNFSGLLRLQTESTTEPKDTAEIVADLFCQIGRKCDEGVSVLGISERDRQRFKMIKSIVEDDDV